MTGQNLCGITYVKYATYAKYALGKVYRMGTLNFYLPDELHKELKHEALDRGIPLKLLIFDILRSYTDKKGAVKLEEGEHEGTSNENGWERSLGESSRNGDETGGDTDGFEVSARSKVS